MLCFPHHPTATAFVLRTTVCVPVRAAVIKLGKNAWVIRGFHEMYLSQNMDVIKVNRLFASNLRPAILLQKASLACS